MIKEIMKKLILCCALYISLFCGQTAAVAAESSVSAGEGGNSVLPGMIIVAVVTVGYYLLTGRKKDGD